MFPMKKAVQDRNGSKFSKLSNRVPVTKSNSTGVPNLLIHNKFKFSLLRNRIFIFIDNRTGLNLGP
eukprot:SAG31_NODE_4372_length_3301_cov_3.460962_1_plen_66_part_00